MGKKQKDFNIDDSPLREIYRRFSVKNPGELQDAYMKEDQRLMHTAEWDYKNPTLLINGIKSALEAIGLANISDEKERFWMQNILMMWYHHAISCALWRYGDREAAFAYSARALELQSGNHPNRITRLLYLLVRDDLHEAEKWSESITTEPEKTTARHLLNLYHEGKFYDLQI